MLETNGAKFGAIEIQQSTISYDFKIGEGKKMPLKKSTSNRAFKALLKLK